MDKSMPKWQQALKTLRQMHISTHAAHAADGNMRGSKLILTLVAPQQAAAGKNIFAHTCFSSSSSSFWK